MRILRQVVQLPSPRPVAILAAMFAAMAFAGGVPAFAGGPRWVAGASYFDPSALGQPLVWRNGVVNYYTDLGDLSATVPQAQADAMVAAAAALWSGIPTAALQINAAGSLAEDVNGSNFYAAPNGLVMPEDVQSTAVATPVGVIYDADGSVLNALEGAGASDPSGCNVNAVTPVVDNFSTDAKIAHALLIVNGLCTADAAHVALVQYELLRGFGRILGLDWSQANDQMFPGNTTPDGLLGWPLMHPVEKLCNSNGNPCMTGTIAPRTDDVAALNRLYPVTAANAANFPGQLVTAAATISIQGTIRFRSGQGMQGVNVVARPLIPGTDTPDMRYPAAAVSGAMFIGDAGNLINGITNSSGQPLSEFGTTAATNEGWYDLSGIPLPPGATQADYQLVFEAVNPLYTGDESVGPYALGQVNPSGTMPTVILRGLTAGSAVVQNETIADSAADPNSGGDGTEAAPAAVPGAGEWLARLSAYGHASWLRWHMRGGRQVTVEGQPLDETGVETAAKARVVIGAWNGDDPLETAPDIGTPQPFNAVPTGLTTLSFESGNDGDVRVEFADQRGDGRPDYLYEGRVLYADTVTPLRVGLAGGPIVIDGMGFRSGNTVTVGGVAAAVTSITPTEITAVAPASGGGAIGNVDVTVTDPTTQGWTTIEGASGTGLSYGPGTNDALRIVTAPDSAVRIGVPVPFTVQTIAPDGLPYALNTIVTYTVTVGSATLGCGQSTCTATTGSDGTATIQVTPTTVALAAVSASIANGASVTTEFIGAAAPKIAALNPSLYLAQGATFTWTAQALALSNALPYAGQTVTWSGATGAAVASATSVTSSAGIAWTQVTAGPLTPNHDATVYACLAGGVPGGTGCAAFTVVADDPATAGLSAISGTSQKLAVADPVAPVVLQVSDALGNPMAGATVDFYQTLRPWEPPCSTACPTPPVLETQTVTAVSDINGEVTLTPLTDATIPTQLDAEAVTGDSASLAISIERHP
jgi:hypothetical protein